MPQAILFLGPPGSGKGTQAELLAQRKNLQHFDTGRHIEAVLHDPTLQGDPATQRELKFFNEGVLNTPAWVLGVVARRVRELSQKGVGLVFSGSPRTMPEALGEHGQNGLLDALEMGYGKDNIVAVHISVHPEVSIARNSARIVCKKTGKVVRDPSECEGEVVKRTLDEPEVIKDRLKQYRDRTLPVLEELKKREYRILEINGEQKIEDIHEEIMKKTYGAD
ncbi:MAG: nucleoside monophosphate kinase [Candidatus Harrisonbacteria bacterium]|nr:nucleoside monophosphate kinase [Candidatus Harrisonbacteria bacterium]